MWIGIKYSASAFILAQRVDTLDTLDSWPTHRNQRVARLSCPGRGRGLRSRMSLSCVSFVSHLTCSIYEIMRSCDHQHPQWKTGRGQKIFMNDYKPKLNLHFPSSNLSPKQAFVYTMGNERRPAEDRGYLLTRDNLNIGGNKMATYCKTLLLSLYIMKPDWEF